jgi:putative nucleotidyltransferase with HDIG domain
MCINESDIWAQLLQNVSSEIDSVISETGNHSLRVARWSETIGRKLKLDETDVKTLYWGALLHDVGKIALPREILEKKGPLTKDEWTYIEMHPTIGANLAGATPSLVEVVPIIHAHQEKYDGNGYPSGLQGSSIPISARILTVVDAYDAMTDDRPYREPRTHKQAVVELQRNRGQQFDPLVVDVFCSVVETRFKTKMLL